MINWLPIQDGWITGTGGTKRFFISMRGEEVRCMYVVREEEKDKIFPESEAERTLVGMKKRAENFV